jgi:predicted DNA-binding protein (MmcQ/YjbR family)
VTADELRGLCLGLAGAVEERPFGPITSVFKVGGKIFVLSALEEEPLSVSLKVEPELGEQLRESYESIVPGYHLNKRHWVTIRCGGDAPDELVVGLIEDSYDLVKPKVRGRATRGRGARSAADGA